MISSARGKVAVITGGAGGIGAAMAKTFLGAGMKVGIADLDGEALERATKQLAGAERLATFPCDVSTAEGNEDLARRVLDRFGGVNLVCLNAGVARFRPLFEISDAEWKLQTSVNLDGPFYGIRAFLPHLQEQEEAHIVITASVMSLFASAIMGPYFTTKAAVLAIAESLYFELGMMESHVGVSALMPGDTQTNAMINSITDDTDPEVAAWARADLDEATPPSVVAEAVLEAVRENRFYILPNADNYWEILQDRFERIRDQRNPDLTGGTGA